MTQESIDALAAAYSAADEARNATERMHQAARGAIAAGVTLPELARVLGITKQAVHARYAIATARRKPTAAADSLF